VTAPGRALVTGASSGIGRAFAERLAREGYDLIVVARRRKRLEALAADLRDRYGVQVEVLPADLTRADDLDAVARHLATDDRLTLLVNNAGFGGFGPFVEVAPERSDALIQLHVKALTRLTRAALPGLIARGTGAIINVSSVMALSGGLPASAPLPARAVYVGTKAFVLAFSEALGVELEGTGVQVQALCPAAVYTELHALDGIDLSTRPAGTVMSPDDAVQASLAALRLGDPVCVPFLDDPTLVSRTVAGLYTSLSGLPRGCLAERYQAPR
jgi:short-subunit dehydrogenase